MRSFTDKNDLPYTMDSLASAHGHKARQLTVNGDNKAVKPKKHGKKPKMNRDYRQTKSNKYLKMVPSLPDQHILDHFKTMKDKKQVNFPFKAKDLKDGYKSANHKMLRKRQLNADSVDVLEQIPRQLSHQGSSDVEANDELSIQMNRYYDQY